MLKNHLLALGIFTATTLLLVSTTQYPGGSQHDATSPGFQWRHIYLSNLLNPTAVNGQDNSAFPWAVAGMLVLCLTVAVFFVHFSKKIPDKGSARVIKYAGVGSMVAAIFTATPWHDWAITISGTLLMLTLFYITVFIFRSRLHWLKIFAVLSLLVLYLSSYMYSTRTQLEWLPVVQKLSLLLKLVWILAMEYATEKADFLRQPALEQPNNPSQL